MALGHEFSGTVIETGADVTGAMARIRAAINPSLLVARMAGAAQVVVTDVADAPLAIARKNGADRAINILTDSVALDAFAADKGHFEVLFEASGNQAALAASRVCLRPGAVIVQLGLGGDMTLPMNLLVTKVLQLRGTFRFHQESAQAVDLMASRRLDVRPLITATLPFDRAVEAFDLACDRNQSMKVQLNFTKESA